MYSVIALFCIVSLTLGSTATQTDWSGGSGVTEPVLSWDTSFYHDTDAFWYNSGSISLEPYETLVCSSLGTYCLFPADIDSDGDVDITSVNLSNIRWWENPGTDAHCSLNEPWMSYYVSDFGNARGVTSADIDGDGDMDLIGAAAYGGNHIVWWENKDGAGTIWVKRVICTNSMGANSVLTMDVDGDADLDIIYGSWYDNNLAWLENDDGLGTTWTQHLIDDSFHDCQSVRIADVNSDGHIDILACSLQWDDVVCWVKQDGTGLNWQKCYIGGDIGGVRSIDSQDIDGDGDMDVVGAGFFSSDVFWWENTDGLGTVWTEHLVVDLIDAAPTVHLMDADIDGDQDIIVAAFPNQVTWWENTFGTGTVWVQHIIDLNHYAPFYVCSADFDGDGDREPLCGTYAESCSPYSEISWWDLDKFQAFGELDSSVLETDAGTSTTWSEINWSAEEPAGTAISFLVRSSEIPDLTNMGHWSDTLHAPCSLEGILTNGEGYVQYKAVLETTDPDTTPLLHDVSISWNFTDIDDTSSGLDSEFAFLPFTPNPTGNRTCVRFETPGNIEVDIKVFSLSGRLVFAPRSQEYGTGVQNVEVDVLPSGIYLCRIRAGDFTDTRRFVIVE